MASLWIEGWDSVNSITDAATRYITPSSLGSSTISSSGGRRSSKAITITNVSGNQFLRYLSPADATCVMGFARNSNVSTAASIFQIGDGTVTHFQVSVATDGTLTAYRGAGTSSLGTSAVGAYPHGSGYVYVDAFVTISNSVGVVKVNINGTNVISLTSQDTQNAGTTAWTWVALQTPSSVHNTLFDDTHIFDRSGSENNDIYGDGQVNDYAPTGNGNTSNSTPSTGSDRALTTDETAANGDTDYNTITAVNDKDTLTLANFLAGATPACVQVNIYAKKTDAGVGKCTSVLRSGGTDYDHASAANMNTSYMWHPFHYNRDPTSAVWSSGTFDAMEVGYKRTA